MNRAKALTPEQMLIIADEFCAARRVRVRDFAALVAAAAVPGARVHGIAVFDSPAAARRALEDTVIRVRPLNDKNEPFARVCGEVYRRFCAE